MVEPGYNYLILEERTNQSYRIFAQLLSQGYQGLCFSTTYPNKIIKVYNLQNARMIWITEAKPHEGVETVNPKRLQFEMMKIALDFLENNPNPVILIDGFGYLILENGIENVRKFIKKINDKASMKQGTILITLNPSSLSQETLISLARDFDSMEDMTIKAGSIPIGYTGSEGISSGKPPTLTGKPKEPVPEQSVERIIPPASVFETEKKDFLKKGEELEIRGEYESALECYIKACSEDPDNPKAWYNRGVVLQILNNLEEAIRCYDRVIALDPKQINAWVSKGVALRSMGDDIGALRCYNEALKINDKDPSLWSKKGILLKSIRELDASLECFGRALFLSPNDPLLWLNKGVVLEMMNNYEEALSCYEQVLRIEPDNIAGKKHYESLAKRMKVEQPRGE